MNISKKISLLLCSLLCIISCIDPIELEDTAFEDFLIVEGQLTDELKQHTIKLTRTIPLDSTNVKLESGANVSITDNLQNTYNFSETTTGVYNSNTSFNAIADREYVLEIRTSNGKTYTSRPEKITGTSTITNVNPKIETNILGEEGLNLYVESESQNEQSKYYKYEFIETFKIIAPFWSGEKLEVVNDKLPDPFEVKKVPNIANNRICYTSENSNRIIQTETATFSSNKVNFGFHFIPKNDFSISNRYSILVKQQVQAFEAYNYYNTLAELASTESIFSENQPGFLLGNITAIDNPNDKAIGYFEVNAVSEKRIFLNREDFFANSDANYIEDCVFIAPKLTMTRPRGPSWSPLIEILQRGGWLYYLDNDGSYSDQTLEGEYYLVPKACGDCTEVGTNVKPSFWVD